MAQTKPKPISPLAALADATATKKSIEKILARKTQEFAREAFVKKLVVNAARNYVRDHLQAFLKTRYFADYQRSKTIGKLMSKFVGKSYVHRLQMAERALEAHRKRSAYIGFDEERKYYERFWDAYQEPK